MKAVKALTEFSSDPSLSAGAFRSCLGNVGRRKASSISRQQLSPQQISSSVLAELEEPGMGVNQRAYHGPRPAECGNPLSHPLELPLSYIFSGGFAAAQSKQV